MGFASIQLQPQKKESIARLCRLFSDVRAEAPRNSFNVPFANVVGMLAREMDAKRGIIHFGFNNKLHTATIAHCMGARLVFEMRSPGEILYVKRKLGGSTYKLDMPIDKLAEMAIGLASMEKASSSAEIAHFAAI